MTLDFKDYPFVSDNTRLGAGYSGVDGEVTVPVSTFGGIVPITINVTTLVEKLNISSMVLRLIVIMN